MYNSTTICAIATGNGNGALAIIRVSGDETFAICDKIFRSKKDIPLSERAHASVHFGEIVNNKEVIDEVLLSIFKNPHSFTGEDSVEISCHGSLYIQQQIISLLLDNGATMANPGEFTQRAFMNGKMDLSQAEAVADLIASTSKAAHKLALEQMRGGFSRELEFLHNELLKFAALVELELDFAEEDVEFADRSQLYKLANHIQQKVDKLANSFSTGNAIKSGIPVAIVGETNVGKSTLLNTLLNDDKAIVSEIHGTTRDVIEDTATLQGVTFRFIDTAGIRQTTDVVENMGIERTYKQIEKAHIVLLMVDGRQRLERIFHEIAEIRLRIEAQKLFIIANKADKLTTDEQHELTNRLVLKDGEKFMLISAREKSGIEQLESALVTATNISNSLTDGVIVTNARHYEALTKASSALVRIIEGMDNHISADFLAQDIRECMHHLGEISGRISTDDLLGYIFKNFCIGK